MATAVQTAPRSLEEPTPVNHTEPSDTSHAGHSESAEHHDHSDQQERADADHENSISHSDNHKVTVSYVELSIPKFHCLHCNKAFPTESGFKTHMLTHQMDRPFTCDTCSSMFKRLHDLKRHMKLHTGEKPFMCDRCSKSFARGDSLSRHQKRGCLGMENAEEMDGGAHKRPRLVEDNQIDDAVRTSSHMPLQKQDQQQSGGGIKMEVFASHLAAAAAAGISPATDSRLPSVAALAGHASPPSNGAAASSPQIATDIEAEIEKEKVRELQAKINLLQEKLLASDMRVRQLETLMGEKALLDHM